MDGHGRVEGIYISARKREPRESVERVRAVAGRGLEGNRHFYDEAPPGAALTLISAEALAEGLASSGVELGAAESGRNVLTSGIDLNALVGVRFGFAWLDPVAAFVVAVFIGLACWEIFRDTSHILGDEVVLDEASLRSVVQSVPEVKGCHQIRTRGSADHVFLDLHVWMDGTLTLHEAHRLSHVVKDRLMAQFPQIKDAVIHIEPPPEGTRES